MSAVHTYNYLLSHKWVPHGGHGSHTFYKFSKGIRYLPYIVELNSFKPQWPLSHKCFPTPLHYHCYIPTLDSYDYTLSTCVCMLNLRWFKILHTMDNIFICLAPVLKCCLYDTGPLRAILWRNEVKIPIQQFGEGEEQYAERLM